MVQTFNKRVQTACHNIKYDNIPSLQQWKKDTANGLLSKLRLWYSGQDPLFLQIEKALKTCLKAQHDCVLCHPETRLPYVSSLLTLYRLTSQWLREHTKFRLHASTKPNIKKRIARRLIKFNRDLSLTSADAKRLPAVRALCWIAADKLTAQLVCGKETMKHESDRLERILQQSMTIPMHAHGVTTDRQYVELNNLPCHLKEAVIDQYRITLKGGLAYCWPWHDSSKPPLHQAICDTKIWNFANNKAFQRSEQVLYRKGVFGFALTFNGILYGAPHLPHLTKYGKQATVTFHSSTVCGQQVLCTGCIGIENGKVVYLNNFSGHYKPAPVQLIHVIRHLKLHMVDVRDIVVECYDKPEISGKVPQFLENIGQTQSIGNLPISIHI